MSKGFGGLPGNMGDMMKQAQKMQERLRKAQEEAELMIAEASAGGGVVKATASGKFQITALTISPEVISSGDVEMVQDLVRAAVNESLTKVQEMIKAEMAKATGGMNIPGLM